MRKRIFNALDSIYPCYSIAEHKGKCESPYIVMKFENQFNSLSNSNCGWQVVTFFLYSPLGDITVLDSMIKPVKNALSFLEWTGEITSEIVDEQKEAYCRRLKFRIPKEVI